MNKWLYVGIILMTLIVSVSSLSIYFNSKFKLADRADIVGLWETESDTSRSIEETSYIKFCDDGSVMIEGYGIATWCLAGDFISIKHTTTPGYEREELFSYDVVEHDTLFLISEEGTLMVLKRVE